MTVFVVLIGGRAAVVPGTKRVGSHQLLPVVCRGLREGWRSNAGAQCCLKGALLGKVWSFVTVAWMRFKCNSNIFSLFFFSVVIVAVNQEPLWAATLPAARVIFTSCALEPIGVCSSRTEKCTATHTRISSAQRYGYGSHGLKKKISNAYYKG